MSKYLTEEELNSLMHAAIVDWSKILKSRERWMHAHHYTAAQSKVALTLLTHEKGCTQSEICEISGVSKQQVSSIIKELEAHECVERKENPMDARSKRILLTPTGIEKCNHINNDFYKLFKQLADECGEDERRILLRSLSRMAELLTKAMDERGY